MRERSPGVWEIVVESGRDPLTGKRRQVSRAFRGSVREARKFRAELLTEVGDGRHSGADVSVDHLFVEWLRADVVFAAIIVERAAIAKSRPIPRLRRLRCRSGWYRGRFIEVVGDPGCSITVW